MIIFHFHLQPQYKYELFHLYFTPLQELWEVEIPIFRM